MHWRQGHRLQDRGSHAEGCIDNIVSIGSGNAYLRDMTTGRTRLVSVDKNGQKLNMIAHATVTADGKTEALVSTGAKGPADIGSYLVGISADGRYVGFTSYANNLAGPNPSASTEVFVRDLVGRTTTRVSVSSTGAPANNSSYGDWLSADGHYVGLWSDASNLVPNDTNGQPDIFVHSLRSGNTYRVSLSSSGRQLNAPSYSGMISADGHHVGFEATGDSVTTGDVNGQEDIFLRNAATVG